MSQYSRARRNANAGLVVGIAGRLPRDEAAFTHTCRARRGALRARSSGQLLL